ncbi:unnamed protein product [Polarella glacialis]|uniref:Methyltransferase FkbM domain-containing protein n=2 Tax=Polarella glacialis TaxID=89957 RepID=A0A813DIB1_POLGL|nr:unnamed protein product [Polarella glacialis]
MSLTVSIEGYVNLKAISGISESLHVIASHDDVLKRTPSCMGVRVMSNVFTARRLLDLRPDLAETHLRVADLILDEIAGEGAQVFGPWAGLVRFLREGLEAQRGWMAAALAETGPPVPSALGHLSVALRPFSIWEPHVAPVFSESQKDPVLERLFGLVGVTNRFYVEVGTQNGVQCNSRYFRVRYGFKGVMMDDSYQNLGVNLSRHFVTPANIADLFQKSDVPHEFDLLSLDTDGNEWLLWLSLQRAGYRPRVVVLEYGEHVPYQEDVFVRYTTLPVHRLCLSHFENMPEIAGGSISGIMALGNSWGYSLVWLVASGTSDLVFVRQDVLEQKGLTFPAQDNPAGLCALADYQAGNPPRSCNRQWPEKRQPAQELLATSAQILQGDFGLRSEGWSASRLRDAFC